MRILVSNDDGVRAPGIEILAEAARSIGSDVWIVAPDRKWTAASHHLTFDRDLTLTSRAERVYACSGTPADCVVAAMAIVFGNDAKPDLVLAGVNDKRNVAEDSAYSGTMAIAREAAFWGIPAIALSKTDGVTNRPAELATLQELLPLLWRSRQDWVAEGHWLSINLPASLPAALAQARIGRDKIAAACDVSEKTAQRVTYRIRRGRSAAQSPGEENALIDGGRIAVVRHRWHADEPLPETLVERWNEALRHSRT